jgi:thymidylate synthase (FAD)
MNQIKAELVDYMGDDLTVVNAARVSFDKESDWTRTPCFEGAKELWEGDLRLITYLATHGHFTPFTHPQITLRETVPIFVARQRFKHVVGFSYNEISRRYVDDAPEFYVPDNLRMRPSGSVKQGSEGVHPQSEALKSCITQVHLVALAQYNLMIRDGVAPEQARMVLPQSMMTSYYVTGSLAAFARVYNQRSDDHAQKEIQDLAVQIDAVIRPLYPVSWGALTQ